MHLGGHPGKWGQGTGDYLTRIGSGVGVQLVNRGVHHGLAAALDLRLKTPDPRKGVLGNRSLGARMGKAALQVLTTRPDRSTETGIGPVLACVGLHWKTSTAQTDSQRIYSTERASVSRSSEALRASFR